MKVLIIAGPNGAGRTTFATEYLPLMGPEVPFVNGDAIAAQLNPDAPDAAAREAGRVALRRMESYAANRGDFAFETLVAASGSAGILPLPPPGWRIREGPAATDAGARERLGRRDYSTRRSAMTKEATRAPDRFPEGEPSVENVMIALRQAREVALARAEAVRQRQAEAARAEKVSSALEG